MGAIVDNTVIGPSFIDGYPTKSYNFKDYILLVNELKLIKKYLF